MNESVLFDSNLTAINIFLGDFNNRIDIAYLYYLPFCMLFISSDRLHRRTAPLFLRDNQEFVWGIELKKSLGELDLYFSLYSDEEKNQGLNSFAPRPQKHVQTLVSDLWDRHVPTWRTSQPFSREERNAKFQDIRHRVEEVIEADTLHPQLGFYKSEDVQSAIITRRVSRKRGKWYQIPKDFGDEG